MAEDVQEIFIWAVNKDCSAQIQHCYEREELLNLHVWRITELVGFSSFTHLMRTSKSTEVEKKIGGLSVLYGCGY